MLFSSIPFLYYFLPVILLCYFLVPQKMKNAVLLVFSLIFYAWGEPKYVLLMLATILLFYFCGIAIGRAEMQNWKKFWLLVSVAVSLGLLAVFKYADFFITGFNTLTGFQAPLLRLALPIGISFYTFQSLSYTIDVYRGVVPVQKNPVNFAAYVTLFPQLIAGPIVRYADVNRELDSRTHSREDIFCGLRRFLIGLGKKILIADQFALLTELFRGSDTPSVLFCWLYAVAFMLHIYFDFSGYSDMAIGLGRIFGFHFNENFNYPYISQSVTEFWRRWHMSLGSWFRDYVYIPMGGNRVKTGRWVLNILTVWILTGLWHGAAWNFVLWGLFFGILLLAEKWLPFLQKLPAAVKHAYVLLLVCISFVLFNAQSISQAGQDLRGMFGLSGIPLWTPEALYYLKSFFILFAVGILGATPLVKRVGERLSGTIAGGILEPIILLALLLLSTACLVDGSFSPFLYFRF
ncbi:MAG: MBOAT family protein [Oscillospiraceae bacterium]|nr:MBOAT family protein [Oscillospiraceae bacterium]